MEDKKTEQRTAQILYISIILLLLIAAVAVGLTGAAKKRSRPQVTIPVTTYSAPEQEPAPMTESVRPAPQALPKIPVSTAPASAAAVPEETEVPAKAEPTLPTFILPTVGDVSKTFTKDTLVYSDTMADYRTHDGIDISAALGEGVMAAADGVVTDVYAHPLMGWTVVLSHDGDAVTVYQNLNEEIPVEVGETVKAGAVIGAVGESAMIEIADEPHLHFSMTVGGETVDPLDYIAKETMTVVYEDA